MLKQGQCQTHNAAQELSFKLKQGQCRRQDILLSQENRKHQWSNGAIR